MFLYNIADLPVALMFIIHNRMPLSIQSRPTLEMELG